MASFDFQDLGLLKQKRIIFCVISETLLVFTLMQMQHFDCLTETWDSTKKYLLKSLVSASYIGDKIKRSKRLLLFFYPVPAEKISSSPTLGLKDRKPSQGGAFPSPASQTL